MGAFNVARAWSGLAAAGAVTVGALTVVPELGDVSIRSMVPGDAITLRGKHVTLEGFPQAYFQTGVTELDPQEALRIIDIQYEILGKAHGYDKSITIKHNDGPDCGAYADARNSAVTLCESFNPDRFGPNLFPLMVTAHEMSHVMEAGGSGAALYLFEHGYSAFLDEHQAEINPHMVATQMVNHREEYGLSDGVVSQITRSNDINTDIQRRSYEKYVADGKPFDIRQEHVEAATHTGQATTYEVLQLMNKYGVDPVEAVAKFDRALKDQPLIAAGLVTRDEDGRYSGTGTPEDVANFVAAAWSVALDRDLREEFRGDLNYPINDELFDQFREILVPFEEPVVPAETSSATSDDQVNGESTLAEDFSIPLSDEEQPSAEAPPAEEPAPASAEEPAPAEVPVTAEAPPAAEEPPPAEDTSAEI